MTQVKKLLKNKSLHQDYKRFELLDGYHPWQDHVPDGYVPYKVFRLDHGKISYFNFSLAKEMGLIDKKHPHQLNKTLKEKVLDTFSIQIINEYDLIHATPIPPEKIKPRPYMASRYLQMQHSNKRGETSGDGRGIWNGTLTYKGITWDINSRGTGVTKLAPGSVISEQPLQTGSDKVGYGCGLVEIDELYSSAIMSETLHRQGYKTERVLAIIDLGDGIGIGVRAAPNLFRPAHIFTYLKQNRLSSLKKSVDYLIKRQTENNEWSFRKNAPYKYQDLLKQICLDFSKFSAWLEADYIFTWLDWDGDNVLINAGIIDYGSIRQLGLRHDQYRYDDVERWSTNLNEQKNKTRQIVQVFAQLVDFLETGKKKRLKEFSSHPILAEFDNSFSEFLIDRTLYRMGFTEAQRKYLIQKQSRLLSDFLKDYHYLETCKIHRLATKVEDGINRPPLFNISKILKQLPQISTSKNIHLEKNFQLWLSTFAKGKDKNISRSIKKHLSSFIKRYQELLSYIKEDLTQSPSSIRKTLESRLEQIHCDTRLTGNALVHIVWELLDKRGEFSDKDIQKIMEQIILEQSRTPESRKSRLTLVPQLTPKKESFLETLSQLALDHNEEI